MMIHSLVGQTCVSRHVIATSDAIAQDYDVCGRKFCEATVETVQQQYVMNCLYEIVIGPAIRRESQLVDLRQKAQLRSVM